MADNNGQSRRGFASMDEKKRREAARLGGQRSGKARHQGNKGDENSGERDEGGL